MKNKILKFLNNEKNRKWVKYLIYLVLMLPICLTLDNPFANIITLAYGLPMFGVIAFVMMQKTMEKSLPSKWKKTLLIIGTVGVIIVSIVGFKTGLYVNTIPYTLVCLIVGILFFSLGLFKLKEYIANKNNKFCKAVCIVESAYGFFFGCIACSIITLETMLLVVGMFVK